MLRRGEQPIICDDVPEEGSSDGFYQQRHRWYRHAIPRGGTFCSVHPEKEATLQCMVCARLRVAAHLSYHCSPECLKSHWHLHRDYHKQQQALPDLPDSDGRPCINKNNSVTNVETYVEVGRTRGYIPTQDDIGYQLKYELTFIERQRPFHDLGRTQSAVTERVRPIPTPPARQMIPVVAADPATKALPWGQSSPNRFTVLSYNLLADLYAKADFAKTCSPWLLHWNYRKRNLLREILNYKADILCLQEVQSDHFLDFWAVELQKAGYVAIYKKKTSEVFVDNKFAIDGCATFFRRDRFQLVKKYEVEFNKAAMSLAESFTNNNQKKQALNRLLKDNVALIAVLEAVEAGPPEANRRTLICVANTHIHANKELSDVKLWQVHTLLKGLEKIAASADIPMLVAGDFNSEPGSAAHSLLVKRRVDESCMQATIDPLGFLKEQKLTHSLELASAYSSLADAPLSVDPRVAKQKARLDPTHKEPLFTNLANNYKGTLDYILYTTKFLQPTAVLELPMEQDILAHEKEHLPNAQYSSDHVALVAEFTYTRPLS
eukprot:CAMPEP_0119108246 /NCGR_PEP_ID=MMETSP1180-20130426/13547_1 /TAXON_ID=3052 ORGANISM="Chlamydomonas cf sp, Strain CCMP681" /NCGR_SAMPLE_ID=MMETSP1180 /ASSEMBLY_ACC=CAM_ASM_000741 /LENGTH=547 /DNA_ID=CAMNT_0007093841 /DNA_START=156 /DNA_END=1799 /DNA_ORIENTATION=+